MYIQNIHTMMINKFSHISHFLIHQFFGNIDP